MTITLSYQRFVIIGTARTGSLLLWSYLNSHPDILCVRGVYGSAHKINFGKFYPDFPEEYHSPELVKARNQHPIEFLKEYVFKIYSNKYKAVGFKYFYDHDRHLINKDKLIEYFSKNKDIKFIHVKRGNLLAVLYSYNRAISQHKWTSSNPDFQTKISISECENHFDYIGEQQKIFDELFTNRTFEIIYEDFVNRTTQTLKELQNFLETPPATLHTETKKNDNGNLSEMITNYEQLKHHFKQTKYNIYFDE